METEAFDFTMRPETSALLKRVVSLHRKQEFKKAYLKLKRELAANPCNGPAAAAMVCASRRAGNMRKARDYLSRLAPHFEHADTDSQMLLVGEAEQLRAWDQFERFVAAASANKRVGTAILPASARLAMRHGNRALASALYEADERSNWGKAFAGKNVLLAFPKSGTTWMRFALSEYLRSALKLPAEQRTIMVNAPLAQAGSAANFTMTHDCSLLANEQGDWADEQRVFLEKVRVRYNSSRVVMLLRDPRDTIVSYYHQLNNRSIRTMNLGSMEEFVRHRTRGVSRVLAFHALIESLAQKPNVLVLHYEDLLADFAGALRQTVEFFGYAQYGSERDILKAAENSRFDAMQELEIANAVQGMHSFGASTRDHLKVRKGRPGAYREELAPAAMGEAIRAARRRPARLFARYALPE